MEIDSNIFSTDDDFNIDGDNDASPKLIQKKEIITLGNIKNHNKEDKSKKYNIYYIVTDHFGFIDPRANIRLPKKRSRSGLLRFSQKSDVDINDEYYNPTSNSNHEKVLSQIELLRQEELSNGVVLRAGKRTGNFETGTYSDILSMEG